MLTFKWFHLIKYNNIKDMWYYIVRVKILTNELKIYISFTWDGL